MRDDTIHDRKRTGWRPAAIDLGQETLIGDGDSVRVFIDTTDPRTSAILTESHEGDHHPDVLDGTHVPDHPEPDAERTISAMLLLRTAFDEPFSRGMWFTPS
jgi:hypothetical protein